MARREATSDELRVAPGLRSHFHPLALLAYFLILAVVSMNYTNPVYLSAIMTVTLSGIIVSGETKKWLGCLAFCIPMSLLIVIMNMLASKNGSTPIFTTDIPLFGETEISLEALFFGLNMGLKLTLIISAFFLYSHLTDPDRAFGFFSRYAPKSALLAILSSLLLPKMKRDLVQIGETMQARGADFESANPLRRIKAKYPLLKILLLSSLEGSWETAEALCARGFGMGKRTSYSESKWSRLDNFIISGALISFLTFAVSCLMGMGFTGFYPRIQKLIGIQDPFFICTVSSGFLLLPLAIVFLRWKSLR